MRARIHTPQPPPAWEFYDYDDNNNLLVDLRFVRCWAPLKHGGISATKIVRFSPWDVLVSPLKYQSSDGNWFEIDFAMWRDYFKDYPADEDLRGRVIVALRVLPEYAQEQLDQEPMPLATAAQLERGASLLEHLVSGGESADVVPAGSPYWRRWYWWNAIPKPPRPREPWCGWVWNETAGFSEWAPIE